MEQNFLTTEGNYTIIPIVKKYIRCKSKHAGNKFEMKLNLTAHQKERAINLNCKEDCFNCQFEDCRLFT